jgi:lipopolysaccharide transport system ATP-binding protein
MDIVIKARNIGKCYRIGIKENINDSLGTTIVHFIKSPFKNYRKFRSLYKFDVKDNLSAESADIVWALRDVSFDIPRGQVVGIIGKNAAGKSTLLKILSRITCPATGYCEISGKVSSLLEVGTGFHPELTGRENVYLNSTILGMRKKEVDRKFDEIVDFSGIEKYIDTPVKRYSSGMKVRLAFSVAAHLEPEILIIDEVLAVGDAAFQKKCLNKMQDVGKQGRTVLFVSHNMSAVTRLCERVILLEAGSIIEDGLSIDVVGSYLNAQSGSTAVREWHNPAEAPGGNVARLHAVRIRTKDGQVSQALDICEPIALEMEYDVLMSGYVLMPHFHLHNAEGVHVFVAIDQDPTWRGRPRDTGRYISTAWIPGNFLSEGSLYVSPALGTVAPRIFQFHERDAVTFYVVDNSDGDGARGDWGSRLGGVVRPLLRWSTQYSPNLQGTMN